VPAPSRPPYRSPWLVAFAAVAVVHLVLVAADAQPWASITKCLLAPLLVGWVVQHDGPRLLSAALALCFLGDLFLEIEDLFLLGMAAFAGAHVLLIRLFVQGGALERLRRRPWILLAYGVAAVALVAWCWGGLEPGLKAPIPVYAALLVSTAATSLATGLWSGLGGALFLVSDGIIALGFAGRVDEDATWAGLAIMSLYLGAIALLALGVMRREPAMRATVTA
jgi:hypothetical protein